MKIAAEPVPEASVLYERKDAIVLITINRPKVLNALDRVTLTQLRAAFESARDDASVLGVILTGAGDKAFIAGADVGELARLNVIEAEAYSRQGQAVLDLIETFGKPVVAAVNGYALGGGCETAMACAIRLGADNAKFGQPKSSLASFPVLAGHSGLLVWSARDERCNSSCPAR